MTKRFLILFCSILLFSFSHGNKTDSLSLVLSRATKDTTRVNILNELYKVYLFSDPDKAFGYAKKALALSESVGFTRGAGSSLNNIGFYYFNKGKSSEALVYYLRASDVFTQIDYKRGEAITFANIGYMFSSQNNYPKALEYFFKSLTSAMEMGDSSRVAKLLENIGMIYYVQGSYFKALDFCMKSLKISEKMNDKNDIASVCRNIGEIYDLQENYIRALEYYNKALTISKETGDKKGFAASLTNIGQLYLSMDDKKKAIENLMLSLNINSEINYKEGVSSCLLNIGDYYSDQKKYSKALEYYFKADKLNIDLKDKKAQATILTLVGEIYFAQNNYAKALESYQKSLDIALQLGIKDLLKEDYQTISNIYEKIGNIEEAYSFHKKYSDIKDSISNEKNISKIADMQTMYETEKQEENITLLKKESELQSLKLDQNKIIMYSLIAVFLLLVILVIFIFNNYRHRQRVKQLNSEIALRESEEKYRDLANLLPQIMFEVNNKNILTFINTAGLSITGYFAENIMDGLEVTDIFAHDDKEKFLKNINEIYNGVDLKGMEYSARKKDGTNFPVLCYFSPYVDKDKNQGLRGIAMDITEHKQVERRILNKVVETEENERKRIAKDLHDGLGPLLSSIKLYVNELQSPDTDNTEKIEMLKYTNELINDAVSSTRTIANNLMPGIISDYGLVKALHSFCNKLNIAKSMNISFDAGDDLRRYDSTVEITLYRVLMELINNSIKHASAKNIKITFSEDNRVLNILFKDDGKGFNISRTLKDPKIGMGLNNIINRVKSIHGTCEFISDEGAGTTVKIKINLQQLDI